MTLTPGFDSRCVTTSCPGSRSDGSLFCRACRDHFTGADQPVPVVSDDETVILARTAAEELSARLGVPVTDIAVTYPPGEATPETAAHAMADDARRRLEGYADQRRARVLREVLDFLEASEADWDSVRTRADVWDGQDAIDEAKSLHDAQLVELFARIGGAL